MVRLRLLRILLPALLLPFLVVVVVFVRQRPLALSGDRADESPFAGPRAEGISLTQIWSGSRRVGIRARLGEIDESERLRLEGVERVEVDRERASPLVLTAERGSVEGKEGQRILRLEGGVEVEEPGAGLKLSLPTLEVDEARSEARSVGVVEFRGPGYEGTAEEVTYGLGREQPATLKSPTVTGREGTRVSAASALVHGNRRAIELEGNVVLVQGPRILRAGRVDVERDAEGRLRRAVAVGSVSCEGIPVAGVSTAIRGGRLEIEWDDAGEPFRFLAADDPVVARGTDTLRAATIAIDRAPAGTSTWLFRATGSVRATGSFERLPMTLAASEVSGAFGPAGRLAGGEAGGGVRFERQGMLAEGERATFAPASTGRGGTVVLYSSPGRKARMARERTRVAAERLETDPRGQHLVGEGAVEASLLEPTGGKEAAHKASLFGPGRTVHFVSRRLEAESGGKILRFEGSVRGWQGERNLSADRVEIEQGGEVLRARGNVTSRFPRQAAEGSGESEYVQITAGSLDYSGVERRAVYEGDARIRQSEGWLEGRRIEVDLDDSGARVREVRVLGDVRFEMVPTASAEAKGPVTGKGDRVIYTPSEQLVRVFGDSSPASVTRTADRGGTTTGRVLRYRLDDGTLEVESEDRGGAGG